MGCCESELFVYWFYLESLCCIFSLRFYIGLLFLVRFVIVMILIFVLLCYFRVGEYVGFWILFLNMLRVLLCVLEYVL